MASLQEKGSRGYKYWQIVESRRVNGKPRPIVLEHLGTADRLLERLRAAEKDYKVKSYSHGAVAALLDIAYKLDIPAIIDKRVKSQRKYMSDKPVRNNLTVGMTLLLGAIGRVCMPTSKRGWWSWAKTTSCEYMLRCSLSKIDSQHFWDLMDALPAESIEEIEEEILKNVRKVFGVEADTLFFDTTNFFTFIATSNDRCSIAQRGKNKQKRSDLRQVGLAMVVTRQDYMPLFHLTYQGNRHDSKVFAEVVDKIKKRMESLGLDLEKHTLVFDRGNNSRKNLKLVADAGLHYVGALSPSNHEDLLKEAEGNFKQVSVGDKELYLYRGKHEVWDAERTIVIFVSEKLLEGHIRGIYSDLKKKLIKLDELAKQLESGKNKESLDDLADKVSGIVKGQFIEGVIDWELEEGPDGRNLRFCIDKDKLAKMEDRLGLRILMTDRHDWETEEIVKAFHGQANVELAFKNVKNPRHLAIRPQYHWTDQKIIVHYFICVLGYLLASIIWRQAREKTGFTGGLDALVTELNNVRLAALIDKPEGRGKPKVRYQLEQMSKEEEALVQALGLSELHTTKERRRFKAVSVYK